MRYRLLINVTEDEHGYRPFRGFEDGAVQPGDTFIHTWSGEVEDHIDFDVAAERVFHEHNVDDRPTGRICPSMSVGDVVVFETPYGDLAYGCQSMGFEVVPTPTNLLDTTWRAWADERSKRDREVAR